MVARDVGFADTERMRCAFVRDYGHPGAAPTRSIDCVRKRRVHVLASIEMLKTEYFNAETKIGAGPIASRTFPKMPRMALLRLRQATTPRSDSHTII